MQTSSKKEDAEQKETDEVIEKDRIDGMEDVPESIYRKIVRFM